MSTSTHPVAPEEVMGLLDGELSPERAAFVSTHLDHCADCQNVKESLSLASQKLTAWRVDSPKYFNENAFLAAARDPSSSSRGFIQVGQFLSRKWTWAPALSVGLVLIAFLIIFPGMFVARKAVAPSNAVMVDLANPEDIGSYQAQHRAGGGGGGTLGKLHGGDELQPQPAFPSGEPQARIVTKSGTSLSEPMIARTVSLSIVVKDFESSHTALDAILARHKGYAASLNVGTPQSAARTLQASLRIPAPQLASALSELKALGRVEGETQNGEEVTQQHADLVARLKNSRETEQRLQDVLRTRTGKVKDVLEVEQEIARVRGEIEQMEAEQKALEHRVDFATVDLKLAEEYKAQLSSPAPSVGMQIRNATVNGFRNAFESLLGIVLCFAEAGPTLILWLTILAIPAWLLWRRYRRAHALGSLVGA